MRVEKTVRSRDLSDWFVRLMRVRVNNDSNAQSAQLEFIRDARSTHGYLPARIPDDLDTLRVLIRPSHHQHHHHRGYIVYLPGNQFHGHNPSRGQSPPSTSHRR